MTLPKQVTGSEYARSTSLANSSAPGRPHRSVFKPCNPMKDAVCPKGGSVDRTRGKIFQSATMNDIRFKADEASRLSIKKHVAAVACSTCGYIELFLADDEIERA